MRDAHSDIIVVSPSGEYLMLVEVKLGDRAEIYQSALKQLKHLMTLMGCTIGLVVTGTRISLLRDSLEQPNGASIHLVGEAHLPDCLRPSVTKPIANLRAIEFADRIQEWLESLQKDDRGELPADLKALLEDSVMPLLQFGEIRAAGPRWSRVAS